MKKLLLAIVAIIAFAPAALSDPPACESAWNPRNRLPWVKCWLQMCAKAQYVPTIGMSAADVEVSSWCFPNKKTITTTASGTSEIWIYIPRPGVIPDVLKTEGAIFFESGVVTAIQNSR